MAPSASRLYVELIFKRMNKYASWEPSRPIGLGDYGRVDNANGEFRVEGNVFDEGLGAHLSSKTCVPEAELRIESRSVKSLSLEPEAGVGDIAGIIQCNVKGRWKFGKRPSAVLLLVNPTLSYIDKPHELGPIMAPENLKDCAVVTETYTCPAYAMGMENKKEGEFGLGFQVTLPGIIPAAPIVAPSAGFSGEWKHYGSVSVLRNGVVANAGEHYTPLFRLMALSPKYKNVERLRLRGAPSEDVSLPLSPGSAPEDAMAKYYPPWGALNNEGESEDDDDEDEE